MQISELRDDAESASVRQAETSEILKELIRRRDGLKDEASKEAEALKSAETAAILERAGTPSRSAPVNGSSAIEELHLLNESSRITKHAIALLDRQIGDAQAQFEAALQAAKEGESRLSQSLLGFYLIDIAPVVAELTRRIFDARSSLSSLPKYALDQVSKAIANAKDSADVQINIMHAGLGLLNGFGQEGRAEAVSECLTLSDVVAAGLPKFGDPESSERAAQASRQSPKNAVVEQGGNYLPPSGYVPIGRSLN